MALPAERTRYYARLRTKRIANGLAELVRDTLPADGPRTLVVESAPGTPRPRTSNSSPPWCGGWTRPASPS